MNIAVVAAIISDGKILSVSRKTDSLDLGFPGGKVEIGESDEEALVREVFEETGISVNSCRFVDERIDADGFIVRMFVVDDFHGVVSTLESGVVSWVLPMQLCSDNCSFKKYNIDLINNILYAEITNKYIIEGLVFVENVNPIALETSNPYGDYLSTTVTSEELGVSIEISTTINPMQNRKIALEVMIKAISILSK